MRHLIRISFALLLIASSGACIRNMEPENPMKVNLSAGISTATTAVKAGGPYDPGSTEALDIQLLRRDPDGSFSEPLDATMDAPDLWSLLSMGPQRPLATTSEL